MTTRQEWLAERMKGIGGSDAGAILGVSPWQSRYGLWSEKTGRVKAEEMDDTEALYWGRKLEDPVAERFALSCPDVEAVTEPDPYKIHYHKTYPFIMGSCDRQALTKDGKVVPLEIKTTAWVNPDEYMEEDLPPQYYAQVQHYLLVLDAPFAYLAVLFMDKREFRYKKIERDQEFIDKLSKAEIEFWELVTGDEYPDLDNHKKTLEAIKKMWPTAEKGEEVELEDHIAQMWDKRQKNKALIKELEGEIQAAEIHIREAFGDAEFGNLSDGRRISYKVTNRKGYQPKYVEPTSYRVLREVKVKK